MAAISEKDPIPQGGPVNGLVGDEKIGPSTRSSSSHHRGDSLTKLDSHIVKVKDEQEDPLGHLPPNERDIIRKQLEMPEVKLSYFTLFRFATTNDLILIAAAALASIIAGAVLPLMTIVFGELTGVFQRFSLGTISHDDMTSELNKFTTYVTFYSLITRTILIIM